MPGAASRNRAARSRRVSPPPGWVPLRLPYPDHISIASWRTNWRSEKREAPPFGLLQVAETIGGADWQPARMAFGETLAGLIAEVPKAMCEPATLASVLRKSNELAELEAVAQSWFEDDPQVAQAVERARGRDRAKLVTYLLQSVIARHRDRWADIVLRTALWMREAPPEADLCWRELAIIAKALVDGQDVTEIGLMRDIALRTIAVLRDAGRM